jgi:hypothetical protein
MSHCPSVTLELLPNLQLTKSMQALVVARDDGSTRAPEAS